MLGAGSQAEGGALCREPLGVPVNTCLGPASTVGDGVWPLLVQVLPVEQLEGPACK